MKLTRGEREDLRAKVKRVIKDEMNRVEFTYNHGASSGDIADALIKARLIRPPLKARKKG